MEGFQKLPIIVDRQYIRCDVSLDHPGGLAEGMNQAWLACSPGV